MRIAHMVLGVDFVLIHFSVLRGITHMVIAGGPFFSFFFSFYFIFCPKANHSMVIGGGAFFSPPKPIAQMAVGGEGPFFLSFFFFIAPVSQSPKCDWW